MPTKQEMVETLKARGIEADETMHPATLAKKIKESATLVTTSPPEPVAPQATVTERAVPQQQMIPLSDVKALIAEAIAQSKLEANAPIKVKKVTEHHAHVWRLDGKWVVDFVDQNKDPYFKEKIHGYNKYNEQKRDFEAWIDLVFEDGSIKPIPLTTYVKNRVLVYCPIVKRHQKDISYSVGEVEKKKEVGDRLIGSGIVVDQSVEAYEETFEIKTPDGQVLILPSHVIA